MRRRALVASGLLLLLAAGGVAAYLVHRAHQVADVRGSSTVQYKTVATTAPAMARDVEWPLYGYQGNRARSVPYPLAPPFREIWRYPTHTLVEFPPSVGFGRVYFSTNAGDFISLNTRTGRRAWHYESGRCVAASPAVGSHGAVYAAFLNKPPCNRKVGTKGIDGEVIDFSAGFGKVRWTTKVGPTESSPLLVGKTVYVGDWNGDVWALDRHTGRPRWRFHTGGPVKGGLAYANHRLYVGSYDGHVYCLSLEGKKLWEASAQGSLLGGATFYSTPAVAYGRVYIGSTDGKVYSFGAKTGQLVWSHDTGGYVYASPAVSGGVVYIGSYSHRFYALDAATGATRWTFTADDRISGSATVVGKLVYFATFGRHTYALDTATGRQVWTYPDGLYTPVVATPSTLFLVGRGTVYAMVPR